MKFSFPLNFQVAWISRDCNLSLCVREIPFFPWADWCRRPQCVEWCPRSLMISVAGSQIKGQELY